MLKWIKENKIVSLLIFVLIAMILIQVFEPNIGKKILNSFNSDLRNQNKVLQNQLDSLSVERKRDSIFYSDILKDLEAEKERIQKRVDYANYKLRIYEDAYKNYTSGDFVPNFITFTKFVTDTDTIPNYR